MIRALALLVLLAGCASNPSAPRDPEKDREMVQKTIQPHLKELRPCYEMAIDAYPGAEGKVLATFDVDDVGSVKDLQFTEFHKSLEGGRICMMDTINKWKFPPPTTREPLTVKNYPFFFSERLQFSR